MKEEVKERIKELRNKKGITQGKLGEILGVSQNAICLIEKGTNKPTVQQIGELSRFFNVSADYLLFGDESTKDIEPIERDFLKIIRTNPTVYQTLAGMVKLNSNFERLAA